MVKLKFLQPKKKRKARISADFFKHCKNKTTALKFWLIASLPLLFILYNYMRKRKKNNLSEKNFYLGVAVYTVFLIFATAFIVFIFSGNELVAGQFDRGEISAASAAGSISSYDYFNKTMNDVEAYAHGNISKLAAANNAGGGGAQVDSVNFINFNRALIFYHENSDKYLAEVVFSDRNERVNIERFILKIKNDSDYSRGVYGAD
jgi:hypothetical protein